jgi:glycine cleavage system aminomethyltransferase T
VDVSTLGKIRVCGPDALQLLNLVYVNSFDTLKIARARYGVMLREDGLVFDDGTVVRLAADDYLITTTTAKAPLVMRHLDRLTQVDWPELEVACTSVTDQYAAMAIAGPKSREILQACIADIDFSDETLPFMGYARGHLGQVPIEICRISFSGELAYELYTGADFGSLCWQALLDQDSALQVYGLDALDTLRTEKGHLTGAEIDGRRSLDDIGMSAMNRGTKPFIGSALAKRSALLNSEERMQIVGLRSVNPEQALEEGMHLIQEAADLEKHDSHGQISSVCYSAVAKSEIALAQLRNGRARISEKLWAVSPLRNLRVEVNVVSSCFYDPKNTLPRTPAGELQRPKYAISLAAVRSGPLLNSDKKMHSAIDSTDHSQLNLYSVASWPSANNKRIDALATLLGFSAVDYPKIGSSLIIAGVTLFAVGPYHCWLQVDSKQSSLSIDELAQQLPSSIASVVDISHSYTKVSLRGKGLRALLSRAIDIDLRTTKFTQQQFALTNLLAVQALVHCCPVDETDKKPDTDTPINEQFDILFNRAYALDAWQHLSEISHHLSATEHQGNFS